MREKRIVARHLRRNLPASRWREVPDPRGKQGRRYALPELLQALVIGMCVRAPTLRDVERVVDQLPVRRELGLRGAPSDTTLEGLVRKVTADPLRAVLRAFVLALWRSKQIESDRLLGISLVAIDGKVLGSDDVQNHPDAYGQGSGEQRRYILKALRAVHVSSPVKPALDQQVIPAGKGEANTFLPFVDEMLADFGGIGLLECITVDAGFTSRENMHGLNDRDLGFIAGLKGDQPTLFTEAKRLLGTDDREPMDGWQHKTEEVSGSRQVTRWFARTAEMNGWHDWTCIRQTWRIRQRVVCGGKETWEDRYFITNLPWGRLSRDQCVRAIRAHWGVENDCFWTLDTQWGEDTRAWVRKDRALEVLGLLRLVAYNIVRLLRQRVFRAEDNRRMAWRSLFALVEAATTDARAWEPSGIG